MQDISSSERKGSCEETVSEVPAVMFKILCQDSKPSPYPFGKAGANSDPDEEDDASTGQ